MILLFSFFSDFELNFFPQKKMKQILGEYCEEVESEKHVNILSLRFIL